jgi:hypothetical protein
VVFLASALGCGGGGHDSTGPTQQIPSVLSFHPPADTLDAIGESARLNLIVLDQAWQPIANPHVAWRSSADSVATVDSTGTVTAKADGVALITATAGARSAQDTVVVAQLPRNLLKVSGDLQTGKIGEPLDLPIVVQATDRLGHSISGTEVIFGFVDVVSGGVSPGLVVTDAHGKAQTTWTLGTNSLHQQLVAYLPGSNASALTTFSATGQPVGPAPTITSVMPDTLVEGQPATITGTNLGDSSTYSSGVEIDSVSAPVMSRTATSITVMVPPFTCKPSRETTVRVTANWLSAVDSTVPLRSVSASLNLAVGQEVILQDPSQFCIRLPASTTGADSYLLGLSAPVEAPGLVLPFAIFARGGLNASATLTQAIPGVFAQRTPRTGSVAMPARLGAEISRQRARLRAEARLRQWEAGHLPGLLAHRGRNAGGVSSDVARALTSSGSRVGDTLTVRVPEINSSNLCSNYTTIRAVVRVVGNWGIWAEDVANPTKDSLTLADIQSASKEFDATIYATDTWNFGTPSDIDNNGRIIIALTRQVNALGGIGGFVFEGDFVPATECASSTFGEIYFGEVPDPDNLSGSGAREKADVIARMPLILAHEFTHIIQVSRRLVMVNGQPMASWEMEGQATLAEELVGNALLGNSANQNYDASVAFGPGGRDWYEDEIVKYAAYFGDLGPGSQVADAPDLCSVYGNSASSPPPCAGAAFYGASWMLQRYISDQYGPSYPGGPRQLTANWITSHPDLSGTANIAATLGVNYDSLFVRFATALALDDRDNGTGTGWIPAPFRITSWNSASLASYLAGVGWGWLNPPTLGFVTAPEMNRAVRGGSTAYTEIDGPAGHPAASFYLANQSGEPLDTGLHPMLWVVRIR